MDVEPREMLNAAREEAMRMEAIAKQARSGDKISMEAGQFGKLSELILGLCNLMEFEADALGSPKYWVPLEEFQKLKRKVESGEPDFGGRGDRGHDFIVESWGSIDSCS